MILLDCDGVLADFVGAIRRRLDTWGFPIEEDQIKHLDLSKSLSQKQMQIVECLEEDPRFCGSIEPYPYARELIQALQGHNYAIVTAPWTPPQWCDERLEWLEDRLGVPRERVMFASGPMKKVVRGEIFVEDSPRNLQSWKQYNHGGRTVLVKRPWNKPVTYVNEPWPWNDLGGWHCEPENLVATVKGLIG